MNATVGVVLVMVMLVFAVAILAVSSNHHGQDQSFVARLCANAIAEHKCIQEGSVDLRNIN